jgi:hypothetical protein
MGKLRHQKMRGVIHASPLWGILGWPLLNQISDSAAMIGCCSPTSDEPPLGDNNGRLKSDASGLHPILSGEWPKA